MSESVLPPSLPPPPERLRLGSSLACFDVALSVVSSSSALSLVSSVDTSFEDETIDVVVNNGGGDNINVSIESTAPSSLEGGGDNVMGVGKCCMLLIVCVSYHIPVLILILNLIPCRRGFYK